MIGTDDIKTRIAQAIPGAQVEVRDLTGTGDHYEVRVVAGSFAGRSAIDRHRMVYAAFQDVMGGALHALSIKAEAPGE
jgi:stress-induced morphogen